MLQKLMFSLDVLLDTRLGILLEHYPEYAGDIVADRDGKRVKFQKRFTEEHPEIGLDTAGFRELYRKRTSSVLPNSMLTSLVLELKYIIRQIMDTAESEPMRVSGIEIDINYAPYKDLSEVELEAIQFAIKRYVGYPIDVNMVYKSVGALSPQYLNNSDYVAMYIYDFEEWLKLHYGPLVQNHADCFMPSFTISVPAVMVSKEVYKEVAEIEAPNGETIDPIVGLKAAFMELFKLEIDDTPLYSIAHPDYIAKHVK